MMKCKQFSSDFKSRVVLEALREEVPISQLASKYEIHATQINDWVKQAESNLSQLFENPKQKKNVAPEQNIAKLQQKIGQLTIERDFLAEVYSKLA